MDLDNRKTTPNAHGIHIILLLMFMCLAFITGYKDYFVGVTVIAVLLLRNMHRLRNLKSIFVVPYWLFVIYGVIVTMLIQSSFGYNSQDLIKGFLGITNFLVFFVLGKLLSLEYTRQVFLKTMIFFGIIYSIYLSINAGMNSGNFNNFSVARDNMGTPIFLTFILIYILFDDFFDGLLSMKMKYICAFIDAFAIFISFSRTTYICLFALMLVFIFFSCRKRMIYRAFIYILTFFFSFLVLINILPAGIKEIFIEKIFNSITETSSSGDWNSLANINNDWRGFEKYSAQQQFSSSSIVNKVFGNGIQSGILVGNFAILVGITSVYIPYLHNSYYTILIKEGILGVTLFLSFFVFNGLFFISKIKKNVAYLLPVCLVILLLISCYVVQGVIVAGNDAIIIMILGYLSNKSVIEQ